MQAFDEVHRAVRYPPDRRFPVWLRLTHFVNFFFLLLLVRSRLSILMDHPRLY